MTAKILKRFPNTRVDVLLKLIPAAGTVLAIFDTVKVLVSRAGDIASLASNVMGAFGAIAGGNLASAASAIEKSLVGGIKVALDFVAKLAKIDTFIDRVRGIIGKVTSKISSVVDPLIKKAVNYVRPFLDKLTGNSSSTAVKPGSSTPIPAPSMTQAPSSDPKNQNDTVETKQSRDVKDKVRAELNSRLPKEFKNAASISSILSSVHAKYSKDGLKELKIDHKNGKFNVLAKASPYTNVGVTEADILFSKNDLDLIVKRRQVVLKAVINGKSIEQSFQSSRIGHAEENFVKVVESYLSQNIGPSKNKVTVQLSSSPCGDPKEDEKLQAKLHNCSNTLTDFAKKHNIDLTVQVLGIYSPKIPGGKNASVEGLKHMLENGIRVEAWKPDQAIANLEKQLGEQLDPEVELSIRSKLTNVIKEMEQLSGKTF